jgi:DNA-binding HxlR family transcriptional regulator
VRKRRKMGGVTDAPPVTPATDAGGDAQRGALTAALEAVGDRWSLQVVAALLGGSLRFGELQQSLPSIASNVLTTRLRDLERHGLVVSRPYSERPVRLEYELTARGADLAGVLRLLAVWGETVASVQGGDDAQAGELLAPVHSVCGTPLEVRYWCPTCEQVAGEDDELWA